MLANAAPDDPNQELREVMWVSPDQTFADGRWFWGFYQEFGFDVHMQRASGSPVLLTTDRPSIKAGSQAARLRILGEALPANMAVADLDLGSGITVKRIVSHSPKEIVAEVDVATDAVSGKRDVALPGAVMQSAFARHGTEAVDQVADRHHEDAERLQAEVVNRASERKRRREQRGMNEDRAADDENPARH